jgi:Cdc6-like AAA superfamily ATPase
VGHCPVSSNADDHRSGPSALCIGHSVEASSRHDAGAKNLRLTSVGVEEIVERSRANRGKAIVFVTGVPGAGKTLVSLNVATHRERRRSDKALEELESVSGAGIRGSRRCRSLIASRRTM